MQMSEKTRKRLLAVRQNWENELKEGDTYSTSYLTQFELKEFGDNKIWIQPPDHCYNKTNKGNLSNIPSADKHNFSIPDNIPLFKCISRGKFIYLGKDYPYSGECRLAESGSLYGIWKNGEFFLADG